MGANTCRCSLALLLVGLLGLLALLGGLTFLASWPSWLVALAGWPVCVRPSWRGWLCWPTVLDWLVAFLADLAGLADQAWSWLDRWFGWQAHIAWPGVA